MFDADFYSKYQEIIKTQLNHPENRISINITDKKNQRTIADKIQDKTTYVLEYIFSNGINGEKSKSNRTMCAKF